MENQSNQRLKNAANILKIRKNVLILEKLISKNILHKLASQKSEKIQKNKIKPIEKNDRKRKVIIPKISGKVPVRTGIIDGAANFFSNTFFGFLFTKILPFLPKATGIIGLLKPAGKFVAFLSNFFLNIVGGFIETGYKVYDQIKGKHDEVKKISVKPAFDSFLSTLNNTLTNVIDIVYGVAGQQKNNIPKKGQNNPKKEQKNPVKGAAVGGIISPTRGNVPVNTRPTRELRKANRSKIPNKQTVPDTNIGKDVGGEARLRRFYRSPKAGVGGILGMFVPKGSSARKTPVDSISNISKTLRRRNLLFGDITSVGSDIALGQKPSKTVYRNTAKDVITLAQYISDKQQEKNKEAIFAMAFGGVIPSRVRDLSNGTNLVEMVSSVIERSVEERVNRAIGEFRRPVGKEEMLEDNIEKAAGMSVGSFGSESGGYSGGLYGGYNPQGDMERQIYDYLTKEKKLNDIQALGLMANIERESSFRPNIREPGGTGIGLFQWSHGRVAPFIKSVPDWETNWKAQIDYALNEPQSLSLVRPGSYATKNFSSPQEAADWWMNKWERPADPISGSRKHTSYLKRVPKAPNGSVMFRAPETSEVETKSKGFKTGLKTGPSGRIGAGTAYHVDARFVKGISLKDKVAMLDSMASAHASEGFVMEFSGVGVNNLRWNPNDSKKNKEELAKRVLVSHHSARPGYEPFDYFIVKQNVANRFVGGKDLSISGIAGANIMAPKISGGSFEYQDDPGGYGRYLILRDKNGKLIMKIGHGDLGMPAPKELGRRFNMDEIKTSDSKLTIKNGKRGVMENGKFEEKSWSVEETIRFNKEREKNIGNKSIPNTTQKKDKNSQTSNNPERSVNPVVIKKFHFESNIFQKDANGIQKDLKKLTGFKKGGLVGDSISGYAPYESYGNNLVVAVQPMIIQKENVIERQIPISFPISSGVNINKHNRA